MHDARLEVNSAVACLRGWEQFGNDKPVYNDNLQLAS